MPRLVLRLLALLVFLLSVSSWRAEECSVVSAAASPPAFGDFDVADNSADEVSAADDCSAGDELVSAISNRMSGSPGCAWAPWVGGLEPGGPPLDTPLKPPRV